MTINIIRAALPKGPTARAGNNLYEKQRCSTASENGLTPGENLVERFREKGSRIG